MMSKPIESVSQDQVKVPKETTEIKHKTAEEIVKVEFKNLDALVGGKSDFRNILAQVYRIMTLLHRLAGRDDKVYALDKEGEMQVEIKKIKETYNSWPVLVITCISGGLSIAGGVTGIFGAFPGTAVGNALAKIPGVGSFFDLAGAADQAKRASQLAQRISSFSGGLSGIGQGAGSLGKLFEVKDEARRAVLQFGMQTLQRKHEDRARASSDENQQGREAIRSNSQADAEFHNIFTRMAESRS